MAEYDWVNKLPRSVRLRLEGTSRYAASVLEEAELLNGLSRTNLRAIQVAAFVISLDRFLREGSAAAGRAVDSFRSVGIDGFTIGKERFEGRNDAVTRGDRLSGQLREVVDPRLREFMLSSRALEEIVLTMGRTLARPR